MSAQFQRRDLVDSTSDLYLGDPRLKSGYSELNLLLFY